MHSSWAGLFSKEAIQEGLWVNNMFSAISPILWTAFIGFVLLALAVDLGVFHRQARTISLPWPMPPVKMTVSSPPIAAT